jgi:hypothetical protein
MKANEEKIIEHGMASYWEGLDFPDTWEVEILNLYWEGQKEQPVVRAHSSRGALKLGAHIRKISARSCLRAIAAS